MFLFYDNFNDNDFINLYPYSTNMFKTAPFSMIIHMFLVGIIPLRLTASLSPPRRALGYVYNESLSQNAPITLSFFIDNTCPSSKAAYPTMIALVEYFGAENLKLVTHLFPLPYHDKSFIIAKSVQVIDALNNDTDTYSYIEYIFDNLSRLKTSVASKLNDEEILDILAPIANAASGISHSKFKKEVTILFFGKNWLNLAGR